MNSDTPVELVTTMDEDSDSDYSFSPEPADENRDTEEDFYYWEARATPLFELSSISIPSDMFNKFPHDVFLCHAKLIDDNGHECLFWEKECSYDDNNGHEFLLIDKHSTSDVVSLCPRDDLLKIIPAKSKLKHRPLMLPKHFFLDLFIVNTSQGDVIMEERLCLDFTGKVVFDEEQCLTFVGRAYGTIKVCYTIFRYALFASVDCRVVKIGQEDDLLEAIVTGNITATSKLWNGRSVKRVVFDNPHSTKTMMPSPVLHWISFFPMPAYSPLQIHARLEINDEIIESGENGWEFEPCENTHVPYKEKIMGTKWCLLLSVTMKHAHRVLPRKLISDYEFKPDAEEDSKISAENEGISDSEDSNMSGEELTDFVDTHNLLDTNETSIVEWGSADIPETEEIQHGHEAKRIQTHDVEHPVSDTSIKRIDPLCLPNYPCLPLMELFSISACPYVDNVNKLDLHFPLHGTIRMVDGMGEYDIFNVVKENSTIVHRHETIPLVDTCRCYLGTFFVVRLYLKDDQGRVISKGHVGCHPPGVETWHNRRLSAVVQGKDGFAAIHYILFSDAVQAKVKVSFRSKDGRACRVRGKIWAEYNGHKYSTVYDKKYYRSVLFKEGEAKFKLCDGAEVPLLKSVVAVPFKDALVVKLNLHIVVADKEELLKGKAIFKPEESKEPKIVSTPQIIKGESCDLIVVVEWG